MSMEELPADAEERAALFHPHGADPASQVTSTFFSTPELRQRLDLLRHLTDNSEKILLIKGVEGAGKSTLLQQYRILARDEWMVSCLTADPMLQPDQFYSLLFRRFGLIDPTTANINGLLKRFEMLHAAGRLPVIVVDDAHLLPVATLIALFRLFERRPGSRALIRVVLFASPDINNHLQMPQVQAMNLQIIQSLDMPLFDRDQAQAFMEFQLAGEGKQRELKLAAGRLERIIRESAGVPGLLEAQLHTVFADAPESTSSVPVDPAGKRSFDIRTVLTDLPLAVLVGAPLLGLLLILTLVYQDEINQLFGQNGPTPIVDESSNVRTDGLRPLKLPALASNQSPDTGPAPVEQSSLFEDDRPVGMTAVPSVDLPERREATPLPLPPNPTPENEPVSSQAEPDQPPADPVAGADTGLEGVYAPDLPVQPTSKDDAAVVGETESAGNQAADSMAVASPDDGEKGLQDQPQVSQQQNEAPKKLAPGQPVVGSEPIKDEKWILTQRPEAYTLQLVGVQDVAAAKRFISRHQLTGQATYFKTIRAGQPWFSVIYGVYPDRVTAIKGRDSLPTALRKSEPWPRTYASIQAAISQ